MSDNLDINSILNTAYRSIDPALLEGKQEYFKSITSAALNAIMSDPSLKVNDAKVVQGLSEIMKAHGLDLPTLDEPKDKRINSDKILKLMMYLQIETEEELSQVQQERLESEKDMLEIRHRESKRKLDSNLDAMSEAATSSTIGKILGWVGVGVAVALAIVVTVVTAGAGAGAGAAGVGAATTAATTAGTTAGVGAGVGAGTAAGAGAAGVGSSVGAGVAATTLSTKAIVGLCLTWSSVAITLTQQGLTQSGEMEKMTKALADDLRGGATDADSKSKADMWAQIIIGGSFMAATIVTGAVGASVTNSAVKAAQEAAKEAAKAAGKTIAESAVKENIQKFMGYGMTAMSVGTLAYQGYNIHAQYDSAMASAAVTEAKSMIALVQQMIEETQEELQEVVEKIDDVISKMFDVINSSMDAEKQIANEMGQMA